MLPPVVEILIAPPFPEEELAVRTPALVSMALFPPVTDRVMFPPKSPGANRLPVVMLPPEVEMVMFPAVAPIPVP